MESDHYGQIRQSATSRPAKFFIIHEIKITRIFVLAQNFSIFASP